MIAIVWESKGMCWALAMFFSYLRCVFMAKFQTNYTCAYLKLSYLLSFCMLFRFHASV
jgi:hypothetical protein